MKRILVLYTFLFIHNWLYAQDGKPVTVSAGERILDYFPVEERYRYPVFQEGRYISKNGKIIPRMFNLNFLSGHMEFLSPPDTMIITDKNDLKCIVIGNDTNYYNNGYLELIHFSKVKVYIKQRILLKEILKKGAMGTVNRNASSESMDQVVSGGISYNMVLDEDMVFQKTREYYFSVSHNEFVPFTRKNCLRIAPSKEDLIKNYIKSEKINFESREDLFKLADFLSKHII